jgi:hypothetical protein
MYLSFIPSIPSNINRYVDPGRTPASVSDAGWLPGGKGCGDRRRAGLSGLAFVVSRWIEEAAG